MKSFYLNFFYSPFNTLAASPISQDIRHKSASWMFCCRLEHKLQLWHQFCRNQLTSLEMMYV